MSLSSETSRIPDHVLLQLASMRPYLLLVFRKGPAYDASDARRIIQEEHLPYLFELRGQGLVLLSMPLIEDANLTEIAICNSTDKEATAKLIEADPAILQRVLAYELYNSIGMPGDALE